MDRVTTDKFDYCDVCKSRYHCTYYHGSMEGLCLEAEVYGQLREYERLGYSPAEVEALIREKDEEIAPKTILGYDARELLIFAQMCKKQGITETELKHCVENFEFAFRVADRCIEESLENVLKAFYFNPKDL